MFLSLGVSCPQPRRTLSDIRFFHPDITHRFIDSVQHVYNLWKTGPTVGWEMDMLIALAPISDTFRFQTGVENVLVLPGGSAGVKYNVLGIKSARQEGAS